MWAHNTAEAVRRTQTLRSEASSAASALAMDIFSGLALVNIVRKQSWLVILFTASLCASAGFAGEVDPRFDGRWVGTETFQYGTAGFWVGGGATLIRFETVLGISDHGKTVGITKGYATGRYEVVPEKSGGNKLEFQMPNNNGDNFHFAGRQHCTLTLSSDGNTIKEAGMGIMANSKGHGGVSTVVWATFHRQGSY